MRSKKKEDTQPDLADSHAHLDMPEFDPDRREVIERAFASGISALLCPMEITDPESIRKTRAMTESHPNIIAAAGVHPHAAKDFAPECRERIRRLAAEGDIRAVGEIGLDFHYNFSGRTEQIDVFRRQLALAQELNLPVVIHSRLAAEEVAASLRASGFTRGGVLHCFTEGHGFAEHMLDLGFFISFSGIVTFPKAEDIRETARRLPLDRILVETDSPFLTPVPHRGRIKRNEPRFVRDTAAFLAELRGIPLDEVCEQTSRNFSSCFRFEFPGH